MAYGPTAYSLAFPVGLIFLHTNAGAVDHPYMPEIKGFFGSANDQCVGLLRHRYHQIRFPCWQWEDPHTNRFRN